MANRRLRLLYLGVAFPPGMAGKLFVTAHLSETRQTQELSRLADVTTVGLLPGVMWKKRLEPKDDTEGLEHKLILWDRNPALWHRWVSWRKLRRLYLEQTQREGMPDVVLVRNLQHVFNHFVKWLRRQPRRPLTVLLLGDSGGLGEKIPWSRRLRYQFKPMQMLEARSVLMYDACLVSGLKAGRYFESRGVPWMWMPCAFNDNYDPPPSDPEASGPIRFGYFGDLSEHSGIRQLVKAFLDAGLPGTLHVCGHGPLSGELKRLAEQHPNFHFDGFLPKQSDCLPWAQQVDVLVNVRPPWWGKDNSAPSKVFEYGVAGRAILSTRTAGMDEILGKEGIYIETDAFEDSLRQRLREVSAMDRAALQRRAAIIRDRIVSHYSWEKQSQLIVEFLTRLVDQRASPTVSGTAPGLMAPSPQPESSPAAGETT